MAPPVPQSPPYEERGNNCSILGNISVKNRTRPHFNFMFHNNMNIEITIITKVALEVCLDIKGSLYTFLNSEEHLLEIACL